MSKRRNQQQMSWTESEARTALARYEDVVRVIAGRLVPAARATRALDEEDLRAEGRIAVLEALSRYGEYGTGIDTWVKVRVRQRMIDAIRRCNIRSRAELRAMKRAEETGDADDRTRSAAARRLVSLDDREREELASSEPQQAQQPLELAIARQQHRRLWRAIETLPERQRTALTLTLLEGLRPSAVSRRMGVCQPRINQLHARAVERVRKALNEPACQSIAPPRPAGAPS